MTGIIKEVDGKRAELILAKVNGNTVINRIFVDFKSIDTVNINKLEKIYLKTQSSNFEKYYKSDLIIHLEKNDEFVSNSNILSNTINFTKKRLKEISEKNFKENSTLINAMVFGLKDDIDKDQKKVFRDLGISHILVASGANILMIMGAIEFFINKLNFITHKKIFGLIIVFFYLSLVGFEGSITRAFFFFVINLLTLTIGRDIDYIQKIFITILCLIFIFPSLVFGISFFLSLAATIAIKISSSFLILYSIENKLLSNFITNLFILVVVNLVTSYYFSSINLAGLITNIIILGFVEIIVVYGFALLSVNFLFSLASIVILDKVISLIAFPLNLLMNIFIKIVDIIYLYIGDGLNYKYHIYIEDLLFAYLFITILWTKISYNLFIRSRLKG